MRIFKSKDFARFARRNDLDDSRLCDVVAEMQAGRIDADLGGSVYKQRVARKGQGKSGGFRTILLLRLEALAIFIHGYRKSDQDNVSLREVTAFREIARHLLVSEELLEAAVTEGKLLEVECHGEAIPD